MRRNGNGNGNGNGRMPSIGDETHETSYPCEDVGRISGLGDADLAVQGNANVANFPADPEVFNESPSRRKSYSWNRGETGNAI
jgi:hypothetical protein